jgi:hypothetical protein
MSHLNPRRQMTGIKPEMHVLLVLALLAASTSAQLSDPIAHDGNMRNTGTNKFLARSAVDDTEDDGGMCATPPGVASLRTAPPQSDHASNYALGHTRRALSGWTASPGRSWRTQTNLPGRDK